MRIKKTLTVLLITMLILLPLALHVSATETETDKDETAERITSNEKEPSPSAPGILSPGLRNIAAHCKMKLGARAGMSVQISEDAFLRALNLKKIETITVATLPDAAKGTLLLNGEGVKVGQKITSEMLSAFEFIPAGDYITSSAFEFSADDSLYTLSAEIYILSETNHSPQIRDISVGKFVSAYSGISYCGHLPGYDPDGDDIDYMISKYPDNGVVMLNSNTGEYTYIPNEGFTGKDSFEYVLIDEYGAYSTANKVVVSVESVNSDEIFSDMDNSVSFAEAISLSRSGILGGRNIGGKRMFLPNEELTRGEFVSLIMNCAGIELKDNTVHTVFADDSSIHQSIRPAVATAYELGYIEAVYESGKAYFKPNEIISIAECARIVSNILSIDTEISIPVSSIIENCPENSYLAVSSLCSVAILPHDDGILDVTEPLTREYAAKVLYNVKSFINLYTDY